MAGKSQRLPSRNDRSAADRVIELLQVSEDDAKEWEAERKNENDGRKGKKESQERRRVEKGTRKEVTREGGEKGHASCRKKMNIAQGILGVLNNRQAAKCS